MAVQNTTIIIALGVLINYILIYRKNRLFGNIMFFLIGLSMVYFGLQLTTASDEFITIAIGSTVIMASVISLIYDLFLNN